VAGASTLALFVRLFFALGVVLGFMLLIATVMKKRGLAPLATRRSMAGAEVEILARKPLGRNASVAIVRAGGRSMVLGVTESQVTMLGDAEITEIEIEPAEAQWTGFPRALPGPSLPWKTMLEGLRDKTVRRS
jgi:flagellar biosynthetic protein FliO